MTSDLSAVRVRLDLTDAASQTITVTMTWTPAQATTRWQLPVWTPGSYTVRDPVQHLHSLSCKQQGKSVPIRRTSPSCWRADLQPDQDVEVRYQLEARQLTVRTCCLEPQFASLCLSAVVMLVDGFRWAPHHLELVLPSGWQAAVPLPHDQGIYHSDDFDALVDSPVHAGCFESQPFEVMGCQHELILFGAPPQGWPPGFLRDISAVCEATCRLMQTSPPSADRYQLVLLMLDQGYGGLEHDHAAVLHYSWKSLAGEDGYLKLLQLIGHEYLHQWNVRRLRPRDYIPYDYGGPVVSDCLWFAEGVTSYFDLGLPLLAGCSNQEQYLKDLGRDLSTVLISPGVGIQSLADSSREAWVRLYKRTPAGADSQISYYVLGTAMAFCLDVMLRESGASLASLLRQLWDHFGRHGRGYGRGDLLNAVKQHHPELAQSLPNWLDHCGSIPIEDCVSRVGLKLNPVLADRAESGLVLREERGAILIERVVQQGPGARAGLIPGDELIALHGHRIRSLEDWQILWAGPDEAVVHFARRGRMAETHLQQAPPSLDHWELSCDPGASPQASALRDAWFRIL
jgi:predicted metalloprotease with PDZ domain